MTIKKIKKSKYGISSDYAPIKFVTLVEKIERKNKTDKLLYRFVGRRDGVKFDFTDQSVRGGLMTIINKMFDLRCQ